MSRYAMHIRYKLYFPLWKRFYVKKEKLGKTQILDKYSVEDCNTLYRLCLIQRAVSLVDYHL